MSLAVRTVDLPPVVGTPGLAQGHYGTAGNLELVAPAADGGLWVFWFNADPVDARSGAVAGRWSGGLHFAGDTGYQSALITQLDSGPDFLEVVAQAGTEARRFCWTPADGFTDRGVIAADVTATSAIVEAGEELRLLAVGTSGAVRLLTASLDTYPDLTWRSAASSEPAERVGRAVDGSVRGLGGPWRAVSAAATTLDGGRTDVVAARGTELWHGHRGPADTGWQLTKIRSHVWTDDPTAPVHRR